jgi:N-acetylglucosamine kinase-like BadF-type ATPase
LIISGTGSIAIGRKGELVQTAGGWGNLIGDEGSGYDLVRRAVRLMTEDADHSRPEKPVCRKVREFFGAQDTRQVIGYLHNHVKADIAKASPVVERAAEAGDPDAKRFLSEAGEALAGLVLCMANRLELPAGFPLALQGSVIRNVAPIRNRMIEVLGEAGITCSPVTPEGDLTCGAWHYAKARQKK